MDEVRMAAVVVKIATILAGGVIACKVIRAYARGDDKVAKVKGVENTEKKDGAVTKNKYDGEEYIYEEGAQKKASNIVQNLTQTQDADIGSFYSVDSYGDVIDNVGDRHNRINSGGRTFVKAQETAGVKAGDLIRIVDGYKFEDYDNGEDRKSTRLN